VRERLIQRWSPRQISKRLSSDFSGQPEMHVVPETIYQALYGHGSLDLVVDPAVSLRSGRTGRRPRRRKEHRSKRFPDMVMIRDRPVEVTSRLVPGHWEGDLIIGKGSRSAIGTLVERTTQFVLLVHLAGNRGAENLRDRLEATVSILPAHLRRSLTWDQGTGVACHQDFTQRTLIPVYFCDPASPWQRGSNENTNGLLRQYFPKGTDLSVHSPEHLTADCR
jgi:IS30 family transposase